MASNNTYQLGAYLWGDLMEIARKNPVPCDISEPHDPHGWASAQNQTVTVKWCPGIELWSMVEVEEYLNG